MSNQKGGIFNFLKKIECQRNNNKVFLESYKNGDLKTILFMIKKDMVNDYCVCDDEGNNCEMQPAPEDAEAVSNPNRHWKTF